MRITDLQWEINKILTLTKLTKEERDAVQVKINIVTDKFRKELIEQLEVTFDGKRT